MSTVYIAGIGITPFGRHAERSLQALAVDAGEQALRDAGLQGSRIGIGFFANALAGRLFGDSTLGQGIFAALGINQIPVLNIENACTSGSSAFYLACQAIRAREVEVALVLGAEKMCVPQMGRLHSGNSDFDALLGMIPPASFAMRAQRHMYEFGTTREQMAAVAVKNRRHAQANPVALYRSPVTAEEVLASPMVADPLTRLQCCPIADGAAAVLLCSESVARRRGARVRVLSSILCSGSYQSPQDLARWETDFRGARAAYEKAGVGPENLDLVECHDAFSIAEILHYEALGLCPLGEGGSLAASGATALGGRIPVNVSGGLLSKGHPLAATGIAQVAEIALQLRGEARERQVGNAQVGLAHCMGGDLAADTKSFTLSVLAV
jgi:acetyl-CoA acetyltransferase